MSTSASATTSAAIYSNAVRGSSQLLHAVAQVVKDAEEVIYTDGSCLSQANKAARRAGYSVNFGPGDARNVSAPIEGEWHTNQIGELTAVVVALERCSPPPKRVTIYSDSHYVIRGLVGLNGEKPWSAKWLTNGWRNAKGKPVDHKQLWERALAAAATKNFSLLYSKAHSGIAGNEMADQMARAGAATAVRHSTSASKRRHNDAFDAMTHRTMEEEFDKALEREVEAIEECAFSKAIEKAAQEAEERAFKKAHTTAERAAVRGAVYK